MEKRQLKSRDGNGEVKEEKGRKEGIRGGIEKERIATVKRREMKKTVMAEGKER